MTKYLIFKCKKYDFLQSVKTLLTTVYNNDLLKIKKTSYQLKNIKPIISYLIDIMYNSSACYGQVVTIISYLLNFNLIEKDSTLNEIYNRFNKKPYNEYFEIWFQRLCIGYKNVSYKYI